MKKITPIVFFTFIQIFPPGTNVLAVTKTTSQSGNWSATSTWGGNPVPEVGDDVVINGNFTVTGDIPNAACLNHSLNN